MKVQLNIIDPSIVAESRSATFVFGIAQTNQPITDYDLKLLLLYPGEGDVPRFQLVDSDENLKARDDNGCTDFPGYLHQPIWRGLAAGYTGGEVAFVKAPHPDNENTYVFFGAISGSEIQKLRAASGRILQAVIPENPADRSISVSALKETGVMAAHTMGDNLYSILKKPIWGFGEEKSALIYLGDADTARRLYDARERYIQTGERDREAIDLGVGNQPDYRKFLQLLNKEIQRDFRIWESESEQKAIEAASDKVLSRIFTDDDVGFQP
ncbi:hypothetical protein HNP46_004258 [Pseudomonas nitritireducens]|uniref:Uncharacterized protein n=1 Tax=Pseudomonas nitroreducens TaxID=46680 RepID=A0A7W7KM71_PSENT|nr:hypothetical protein [Pseudomonas nitritireducens]MBB4865377.1 hypothetical protein [Pseudomonas nitritireducens]